jgi:hydrogenase maturation protease
MKISVIGIGNILRGDDGIGVTIAENMKKYNPLLEVYKGEQDIDFCIDIIEKSDYVYIIDCAKMGGLPGSIYTYDIQSVLINNTKTNFCHECNLIDFLRMAYYNRPEEIQGKFVGIEPESIGYSIRLSETLKCKIPIVNEMIMKDIESVESAYSK